MLKNVQKLCAVSGMLEMLAHMEGCTITSNMTDLMNRAAELLDSVNAGLLDFITDEGANKKAFGGFIRMDE